MYKSYLRIQVFLYINLKDKGNGNWKTENINKKKTLHCRFDMKKTVKTAGLHHSKLNVKKETIITDTKE